MVVLDRFCLFCDIKAAGYIIPIYNIILTSYKFRFEFLPNFETVSCIDEDRYNDDVIVCK